VRVVVCFGGLAFASCLTRLGDFSSFSGLVLLIVRFVALGFAMGFRPAGFLMGESLMSSELSSSENPTTEKADWRRAIGMKNGLGHGGTGSDEGVVERIDGTRSNTGLALSDGVRGSRMMGLKKISSDFKLSGDEQSL